MKRFAKTLVCAAILSVGTALPSFAFEAEANLVWWAIYDHYNFGDQTACITENYNPVPVRAVFRVFPAGVDVHGVPVSTKTAITLRPFQTYKVWGWDNAPGPGPRCELIATTPLP